ncbi:MAG: hypothetical protein QM723_30885 [Myxococcaceae bacterium]
MTDRAALWIVRFGLAVLAVGLLWWGANALELGGSLQEAADEHAIAHHSGRGNKLSAGGDVLSEVSHVFGMGAVALGVVAGIAAVFPYRRFSRKTPT